MNVNGPVAGPAPRRAVGYAASGGW